MGEVGTHLSIALLIGAGASGSPAWRRWIWPATSRDVTDPAIPGSLSLASVDRPRVCTSSDLISFLVRRLKTDGAQLRVAERETYRRPSIRAGEPTGDAGDLDLALVSTQ